MRKKRGVGEKGRVRERGGERERERERETYLERGRGVKEIGRDQSNEG